MVEFEPAGDWAYEMLVSESVRLLRPSGDAEIAVAGRADSSNPTPATSIAVGLDGTTQEPSELALVHAATAAILLTNACAVAFTSSMRG